MKAPSSCAFVGHVVHKRLRPRQHAFRYRVFCLCLDVDEIDGLATRLRLFSRNKRNLLSFYDRDFGDREGISVGTLARGLLKDAGLERAGHRIELLCYPRLLGFVFNPLSVYFCYDAQDELAAIIYEVTNTFKERRSYVLEVAARDGTVVTQACAKEMYVSPFTQVAGSYDFHVRAPGPEVVVGVAFRDEDGPAVKTHFRGQRVAMTDAALAGLVARHPLMTLKVVAAIHYEALRLWMKRVPFFSHRTTHPFSVSIVKPNRDAMHVQ
jgi:DUF1365 family protein